MAPSHEERVHTKGTVCFVLAQKHLAGSFIALSGGVLSDANASRCRDGQAWGFHMRVCYFKFWAGFLFCSVWMISNLCAQSIYTPYAFTNFVGEPGVEGWLDGTGSAGRFNSPHGVAVDPAGNVFIADTFNHVIRKVTPAGVMTTIAGSPGYDGYGDGFGFAEAAKFASPIGIASDAHGNLYLADNGNQTIRKITPAGVVTLFAGRVGVRGNVNGDALTATFNSPDSTIVDSSGNVFVSDGVNRVIRKITPLGVVSLFAGSFNQQGTNDGVGNAARFQQPMGLAIDQSDIIYVADQNANTIRKITPAGAVTTLAGLGRSIGSADGTGTAARFQGPEGVAVDVNGFVYVADSRNRTIRRITPGGLVTTIAGAAGQRGEVDGTNGVARFGFPRGIVINTDGNIYVADSAAIRKLVIDGADCVVTTFAGTVEETGSAEATGTSARFDALQGLARDSAGNLYVVDRNNDAVRKITPAGVVTTLAGVPGFQGSSDGIGGGAQFRQPEELSLDEAGNIYVVEHENDTIRKMAPVGTNWVITTLAGCATCPVGTNDGPGLAARFDGPFGITASQGHVFVADSANKTIRKLTQTPTGWEVSTFAGRPKIGGSADGTGSAALFSAPLGLASDAAGNIYVGDSSRIRRITPAGAVSTLAGQFLNGSADGAGETASFWGARGVGVDNAGAVYVADQSNHLVRKLTPDGASWNVTTIGGKPGSAGATNGLGADARFNRPTGVAVDSSGNVYVVDSGAARVTKGISTNAPSLLRFDTAPGGLTIAGGNFTMKLATPSSGAVILEASQNLIAWVPIQTNALSAPTLEITIPLDLAKAFYRLKLGTETP